MVNGNPSRVSVLIIARIALMGAMLYASQVALSSLPNIEIVTLLIVIFTKNLGKEGTAACFVYVCLTVFTAGFGLWWVTYLIVWPAFSFLVLMIRRNDNWLIWAVINGGFGLCFGAIFALPYIFVSPSYALSYWLGGIPFDIAHCIGNFAAAIIIGKPLDNALKRILKYIK